MTSISGRIGYSRNAGYYSCALRTDRTLACWNDVPEHLVSLGSYDHLTTPPPDGTFLQVSAGANHSCAIRSNHTVTCWGLEVR